jgi:glutamate racemase
MTTNKNSLPIGVFDSGVGGLTVLHALKQQLPQESFYYLGDTARLPYGTKSGDTIIRYALQAAQLLINKQIKLLVIACNTATALALPNLKHNFLDIPIIGVIEPGATAALAQSTTGQIAVIATEATVNAKSYHDAIFKINPEAKVIAQACQLFVALTEDGWTEGPVVEAVAKHYLDPLLQQSGLSIDCLILGCTHFPVLINAIKKVVGSHITVVDSAQTTAHKVAQTLTEYQLHNTQSEKIADRFFVTDAPERFERVAKQFLHATIDEAAIELVDL